VFRLGIKCLLEERSQVRIYDRESRNRNVRRRNDVRDYEGLRCDAITVSYLAGAWGNKITYSLESWVDDSSRRSVGYGRQLGPT
jgi:hypothetical protein